jgi:ATP-dependent protease Clp ATPase subunit
MYDLPAKGNVKKCIVTKNVVLKGERPIMLLADGTEASKATIPPATTTTPPTKAESA